ncbi:MAG: 5'-3' exonuclease [Candidatus Methylomirabilales bacterium]
MSGRPRLFLVDGSSYVYRAFHALPPLTGPGGHPTHATYGFTAMLLRLLREQAPEYAGIVFDTEGPTERHRAFEAYKAQRPPMPEALAVQLPDIRQVVTGFRLPLLAESGQEADDLLGSLAVSAAEAGFDVVLVTGDKDMCQVVGAHVRLYDSMRDRWTSEAEVRERFGVPPAAVPEVMGLMGDSVDNIPGVPGVGEKTAKQLIAEFGSIENLLSHLEGVKRPRLREALAAHAKQARLSRALATIRTDLPIPFTPAAFRRQPPDLAGLGDLFRALGFTRLLEAISQGELPGLPAGAAP